jgi:hypothetical protein
VSLLVTALLIGGGALAAGAAVRLLARRKRAPLSEPALAAPLGAPLSESGFGVEQGDVISVPGRELWLEQGWLLREAGEPIAAILFAREATIVALPEPNRCIHLLQQAELALPAEPPSALDHAGVRYERTRRLPVEIEVMPQSPEPPWPSALLVEYRGLANEVLWALVQSGSCSVWCGRALDAAEIERWGGGAETLEP